MSGKHRGKQRTDGRSHRKNEGNEDGESPPINMDSPIAKAFFQISVQLDARHDKYEALVKKSRDVTIESKRIIFLLHRINGVENQDAILKEAAGQLVLLQQTQLKGLATLLRNEDPYLHHRAYSPGLQEYVEAVSFYHYLKSGELVSYEEAQKTLEFEETVDGKDVKFSVLLTQNDFMLGIADLTGELMRRCINSVGCGNTDIMYDVCNFLREIYNKFVTNRGISKEFNQKVFTLKQSLKKVENACYMLRVRGSEIPQHMLKDMFNIANDNHQENDDDV